LRPGDTLLRKEVKDQESKKIEKDVEDTEPAVRKNTAYEIHRRKHRGMGEENEFFFPQRRREKHDARKGGKAKLPTLKRCATS